MARQRGLGQQFRLGHQCRVGHQRSLGKHHGKRRELITPSAAMSFRARIFITAVIVAGGLALARSLFLWRSQDLAGFLVYFVIALLVSGLKLQLPGVTGTISVCFFFVLIGIVSLDLPQVLVTGCAAVLVQYLWQATKKLQLVQ